MQRLIQLTLMLIFLTTQAYALAPMPIKERKKDLFVLYKDLVGENPSAARLAALEIPEFENEGHAWGWGREYKGQEPIAEIIRERMKKYRWEAELFYYKREYGNMITASLKSSYCRDALIAMGFEGARLAILKPFKSGREAIIYGLNHQRDPQAIRDLHTNITYYSLKEMDAEIRKDLVEQAESHIAKTLFKLAYEKAIGARLTSKNRPDIPSFKTLDEAVQYGFWEARGSSHKAKLLRKELESIIEDWTEVLHEKMKEHPKNWPLIDKIMKRIELNRAALETAERSGARLGGGIWTMA